MFLISLVLATAFQLLGAAPVERELAGGDLHVYRAEVAAGRPLLVTVEQEGIDVVVVAVSPGGGELPPVDSPNGRRGPEILVLAPDPAGEYRIEIRAPSRSVPPGHYRISMEELAAGTPAERERLAASTRMMEAARAYQRGTAEGRRRAIGALEAALASWRSLGRVREEAETLFLLAAAHRALGEPRPALDLYLQALARRLSLADPAGQADALLGAGLVRWELGDNPAALDSLGRALALFQAGGDRSSAAAAQNNLCLIRLADGELAAARTCFEQARAEFAALGDGGREAAALNSLGGVWDGLGEPLQARDHYARALAIYRQEQDRRGESQALNNLAGIHAGLGELGEALDLYTQALDLFRGLGDSLGESSVLNNLGFVYLSLGEPERARPNLEEALELRRRLGDRRGEAVSLTNLGLALARLGDPRQALAFHAQAIRIAAEAGDRGTESAALEMQSRVQIEQGDYPAALATLGRALPLTRAMGDRSREALVLLRLGRAQAGSGREEEALASLEQALALHREVLDPVRQIETLQELARLDHRRGREAEAWARSEEALDLLEPLRTGVTDPDLRASFLAARQGVFELAIELRMRRAAGASVSGDGDTRDAFELSERAHARSLLDLLGEAGLRIHQGVDPDLLLRRKEVLARLAAKSMRRTGGRGGLEALLAEADRIEAEIRRLSPRYAARLRPAPLGTAAIQNLLDTDTLLLEISLGEERSYLWAVSAESVAGFELPGRGAVEERAGELQRRLRSVSLDGPGGGPAAAELSRMVLGPVAGLLGNKRLVVVADGALQLIPWAVLPEPGSLGTPGEPLLVRHEIVSLPSASVLALQRQELATRPPAPKTLAVLADPVFDRRDSRLPRPAPEAAALGRGTDRREGDRGFSRLPATRREAAAIAALVPSGQLLEALDFKAGRATAEGPEMALYRIVHFATHGVLDTRTPELSGLVLSLVDEDGRPQDGFLGLGNIYNLRLGADLVVLSGCETALGKQVRGEGLVGLTQGFFYAGARRIVASLWQVQDRSTAELMTRFYQGMLSEGLTPAAALRQAQLAVRRDPQWRDPYFWAPFIVQGDWR